MRLIFMEYVMSDLVNYQGRMVSRENFRVYIFSSDGSQKLVNSYAEYLRHMDTGDWFATRMDATLKKDIPEVMTKGFKQKKDR